MKSLSSALSMIPCLLSHATEKETCSSACLGEDMKAVDLWLSNIYALLMKSSGPDHPGGRIAVLNAFHRGLKHVHYSTFEGKLAAPLGLSSQGLKSKQRSERLGAG